MTREEAINFLQIIREDYPLCESEKKSIEMAIKALEQEPTVTSTDEPMTMVYPTIVCDDAISRQAVIKTINNNTADERDGWLCIDNDLVHEIEKLPSVTQKSGKWVLLDECANSGYYCSECHKKLVKEGWSQTVKKIKFCPNCGARMESEDKE